MTNLVGNNMEEDRAEIPVIHLMEVKGGDDQVLVSSTTTTATSCCSTMSCQFEIDDDDKSTPKEVPDLSPALDTNADDHPIQGGIVEEDRDHPQKIPPNSTSSSLLAQAETDKEDTKLTYNYMEYEEAEPQRRRGIDSRDRRRSSLLGHIMAWAGAINEQHVNAEFRPHSQHDVGDGATSSCGHHRQQSNKRASLDVTSSSTSAAGDRQDRRGCVSRSPSRSNDDEDDWGMAINRNAAASVTSYGENEDGHNYSDEDGTEGRGSEAAVRRNSLHAMVERAMAYVNLRSDRNDDDLTPFGTRRDSLY